MKLILAWLVCLAFWAGVSMVSGAKEPWDATRFWSVVYPAALALSVAMGALFERSSWSAGAVVMFAQLPVTMVSSGLSPLMAAGVIYAAVLAIPAIALSWLSGWIWRRWRRI